MTGEELSDYFPSERAGDRELRVIRATYLAGGLGYVAALSRLLEQADGKLSVLQAQAMLARPMSAEAVAELTGAQRAQQDINQRAEEARNA